jgi:hypothetical protein
MAHECPRCAELSADADEILKKLNTITTDQLAAFRRRDDPAFMRLDKELELTIGAKERTIGSLREHRREHGHQTQSKAS